MPHATQDEDDDNLLSKVLAEDGGVDLGGHIINKKKEVGDKADDALDYGDIDDDDLAEDEDETAAPNAGERGEETLPDTTAAEPADLFNDGDLFGDGGDSPPPDAKEPKLPWEEDEEVLPDAGAYGTSQETLLTKTVAADSSQEILDPETLRKLQLQEELFRQSRRDLDHIPRPAENNAELLASLWPKFEEAATPKWTDLFPPKRSQYTFRDRPKPPKNLHSTKLHVEVDPDEFKSYLLPSMGTKRSFEEMEAEGVVKIGREQGSDVESDGEESEVSDFEHEIIGGSTWQDIQLACGDWEIYSDGDEDMAKTSFQPESQFDAPRPFKKQKTYYSQPGALDQALQDSLAFHDPELATSRLAKKIFLDLNDPYLLIDEQTANEKKRHGPGHGKGFHKDHAPAHDLSARYNVSNDEAYDLLKENHQHKVRGTLGNVAVEHGMPALRLQYPFV